jgi:outer membrane receptor protein involved in Fe transport
MKLGNLLRRQFLWALGCVATLFLVSTAAFGQLSTATMSGTVMDSSGAVVPNATVLLTQTATNFTRSTTTDAQGVYHATFLPTGSYTIKVDAQGFKSILQSGIVLTVNQQASLDFTLQIGTETTAVEVTAEVPLVNQENSVLGGTVDNRQIDNLPMVGRNVYDLLNITPGVQNSTNENSIGLPAQHVIINGSTDNMVGQVTYYLDGGLNMTGVRNTGNVLPNPDAMDQFNVQTNNFSAEYGRTGAGVVSVITKSGSNSFHGSIFEFHQETNFNATSFGQTSRQPQHINRFGATSGGPVLKNKIFFFGTYGGLRQITPQVFNGTVVPDALQRVGNFSENLCTGTTTNYGGCFTVYDPVTNVAVPGNRLDLSPNFHPDPVAAAVLAKNVPLPSANRPTPDNKYVGNIGLPNQTDEYLAKGDLQFVPNHRISFAYFQSIGSQTVFPGGNLPGWALSNYNYRQQNANASDVWTVSPRSVNQLWLSMTRMMAGRVSNPAKSLADYGSDLNVQGAPSLPNIAVANFFTLGQSITGPVAGDTVYGVRDVLSTTRGAHQLNIGAEIYLEKDRLQTLLNNYGTFTFSQSTSGTHNAISDFLIGKPANMGQDSPDDANENYFNYGLFVQDNWRLRNNLAITLGLRYDVQTSPIDTQKRIAIFKPGVQSTVSPTAMLGQLFPGDPGVPDGGTATNYNHFSPRLGFNWDPFRNNRTVIHGAAGLFFDTIGGNEWMLAQNFQPFAVRMTGAFTHVTSLQHIYSTDPSDFAGGVSPFPYVYDPKNPRYVSPAQLVFVQENMRWPFNYQINFGVQQQIRRDLAVSINYVASLSRKLPLYIDMNPPVYNTTTPSANTTGNVNCRRTYDAIPYKTGTTTCATPAVGSKYLSNAWVITDGQTANYNGLQIVVDKRLSRDFSVNGFYIWSKGLASASMQTTGNIGNSAGTTPEDYGNMYLERQREDNDMRHQSVISLVWKPNYFEGRNRVLKTVADGWSLAAHVTMRSGKPFTITSGKDDNVDGTNNDRPNLVPGKVEHVVGAHRSRKAEMAQWFDTNAYCEIGVAGCPAGAGPGGIDGTIRVNSLSAPGYKNVNASLFRDFIIHENMKFQFRGEANNVFNFVNLNAPGGAMSSPSSFGIISGAATMRVIQVGGKLTF